MSSKRKPKRKKKKKWKKENQSKECMVSEFLTCVGNMSFENTIFEKRRDCREFCRNKNIYVQAFRKYDKSVEGPVASFELSLEGPAQI